jgi:hypothetical protein
MEVFVIIPNFTSMTKTELRAYIIAHPNDKAAFHTFIDRFASETPSEIFDIPKSNHELEQVENLIKEKLAETKLT